nr:site-specific DNA-methyltransferase [Xylella fastidiosa]
MKPKANAIGDVWTIPQESKNPHPAPFPVELAQRCIESVGAGPVLDPFMGSGTIAVAAEILGCDWVGIEKSPKYVEMSLDRLKSLKGK